MGIGWWDKAPTLTIHWYTDIAVIECTKSSKELSNSRLLLPLLTKTDSDSGDKPAQRPGYNKHSSNQARISQSSSLVGSSSGLHRLYYSWFWILMNWETMTSWILSKPTIFFMFGRCHDRWPSDFWSILFCWVFIYTSSRGSWIAIRYSKDLKTFPPHPLRASLLQFHLIVHATCIHAESVERVHVHITFC